MRSRPLRGCWGPCGTESGASESRPPPMRAHCAPLPQPWRRRPERPAWVELVRADRAVPGAACRERAVEDSRGPWGRCGSPPARPFCAPRPLPPRPGFPERPPEADRPACPECRGWPVCLVLGGRPPRFLPCGDLADPAPDPLPPAACRWGRDWAPEDERPAEEPAPRRVEPRRPALSPLLRPRPLAMAKTLPAGCFEAVDAPPGRCADTYFSARARTLPVRGYGSR